MKQDISIGQVIALVSFLALLSVVGYGLTVLGVGITPCDPQIEACGGGGPPPPPPPPGGCAGTGQSCSFAQTCCAGLSCSLTGKCADLTPPTTGITSPNPGTTISGVVTVRASASDAGGVAHVELYRSDPITPGGWALVGDSISSPYTFSWDTAAVANGSYQLQTRAYDTALPQNVGISANVNVTVSNCATAGQSCSPLVAGNCCAPLACQAASFSSYECRMPDTVPPSISVTSPTGGAWVKGTETVQVDARDNSGVVDHVDLYVDGVKYATSNASPFSIIWNTTSHANANAVLQARAYDGASPQNEGVSASVTVRVQNNPPPPLPGGEVAVLGWAWSSQDPASSPPNTGGGGIGWVALNCYDDPFAGCFDPWGVKANKTNGTLSGYAWSSNIGWINFGPPPDPVTGRYPEDPQRGGKINWADGTLSGWVRSVNYGDGWDGWIKLAGTAANGDPYGVKMNLNNGELTGFAWGNDVVGWLNFHPAQTTPRRPGGRIEINPLNP